MIALWIDEKMGDIDHLPTIPIDFDAANLTNVEGARNGRSIELSLPATPRNNSIFGASCDLHATKRFNMEHHTARIEKEGITIFDGTLYLLGATLSDGIAHHYSVRIREGGAEWIDEVVHGELSDLTIPFSGELNLSTIADSWEGDRAVRFLPVCRNDLLSRLSSASSLPVERIMLTDDYHPFISIAEMVRAMFAESGYTLRSNFFDSDFGRSLYMSGDYSRTDNTRAKAKCDFLARRASKGIATADFSGRVYASTAFAAHSVGPIVDTADAEAVDEDGAKMSDTFSLYSAFSKNSAGNICFTPKVSVKAGFLLHLEYTTEYKIRSRELLSGFDTFEGLNEERVVVPLANNYHDYRNEALPKLQYRALIFDHNEGQQYQLIARFADNTISVVHRWSARSALITTPEEKVVGWSLLYRSGSSGAWDSYKQDWALYAGYINEEGSVDVEMNFRLAPQDIAAGESFVLDKFWFGGAEPGMKITVGTGTSLRPYFTLVPGYNSKLEFKDIAPRNIRQVELLTALGEMFNLAFYTDRTLRELHIEPLETLYNAEHEVDWSHRIDRLSELSITDSGVGEPQNIVLSYLSADYASQHFNKENETTLGRWSFRNPLYGSKESTKTLGNKLFTTTLNTSDIVGSAPSASIMRVGDSDNDEEGIEVAFTPRIVCYTGLEPLPEGESWGATERIDHYPYAAFVDDKSINLCFEDRNAIAGLNRYYKPMLQRLSEGRRIILPLRLTTAEVATLLTTDGTNSSLRTRFWFNIQGESLPFRLAKIGKWDAESGIAECTFEQELNS